MTKTKEGTNLSAGYHLSSSKSDKGKGVLHGNNIPQSVGSTIKPMLSKEHAHASAPANDSNNSHSAIKPDALLQHPPQPPNTSSSPASHNTMILTQGQTSRRDNPGANKLNTVPMDSDEGVTSKLSN